MPVKPIVEFHEYFLDQLERRYACTAAMLVGDLFEEFVRMESGSRPAL